MSVVLLDPPGPLYAQYRAIEDALEFAKILHERQLALKLAHPAFYDPDVHAIVLAFNLRVIGRKLDALIASFRGIIQTGQAGTVSQQTSRLQAALQQYNGAVACRDAWENPVEASLNVLDLAFDCFASVEGDIRKFEERN